MNALRLRHTLRRAALPRATPSSYVSQRWAHDHAHGHDSHGHHAEEGPAEYFPEENFATPTYFALFAALGLTLVYQLSPTKKTAHDAEESSLVKFFKYNVIAPYQETKEQIQEKLEQRIEESKTVASNRLLFYQARMPAIVRLNDLSDFENASPSNIALGSTVDLSDLVVKAEKDDYN